MEPQNTRKVRRLIRASVGDPRWVFPIVFLPIFVLFCFVATMQRTTEKMSLANDGRIFSTSVAVSYWGGAYRRVIRSWSTKTGKMIGEWELGNDQRSELSPSGRGLLTLEYNSLDSIQYRLDQDTYEFDLVPTNEVNSIWFHRAEFIDDWHVILDRGGTLKILDMKTGERQPIEWERPRNELMHYWDSPTNLIWVQAGEGTRSYHLDNNELVLIGASGDVPFQSFFDQGRQVIVATEDGMQCDVVDVATGKVRRTMEARQGNVLGWRATENRLISLHHQDGAINQDVVGLQSIHVYDPDTGKPIGSPIDLDIRASDLSVDYQGDRVSFLSETDDVWTVDLGAAIASNAQFKVTRIRKPDLLWWWWPLRAVGISAMAGWWFFWALCRRQYRRSFRPLLDVVILHGVLFVCSGVRLYAYVNGPLWSGYLHHWESVIFLGTCASILTWFLCWAVFGSQPWPIRIGSIVLALSIVTGVIVAMWDIGSEAGGYDGSLARSQTLIGVGWNIGSQAVLLFGAGVLGWRLHNLDDTRRTGPVDELETRRVSRLAIRDLIGWMIAFAILFVVFKLRPFLLPKYDNLLELFGNGCGGGLAAVCAFGLVLGVSWWRFPIAAAGLVGSAAIFWAIQRFDVMHVGTALIPLLFASGWVFRMHGYRLCRRQPLRSDAA